MPTVAELRNAIRTIPDFPEQGIQFKDITPILASPALLSTAIHELAAPFADSGITKVVGIEARGFILGPLLAQELGAGFVPIRKKGKLPAETVSATYELEYGSDTVEMHADAVLVSDEVLIHDDVIATGGTAAAAADLVRRAGGSVLGYSFLLELSFLEGRSRLDKGIPYHALIPVNE